MKRFAWCLGFCLILIPLVLPAASAAAEPSSAYSDKDLDKYRNPADGKPSTMPAPSTRITKKALNDDKKEQEYWCREGTKKTKVVDKARDRVQSAETAVAKHRDALERKSSDRKAKKRLADAQKKLTKEQKKLAQEEAALSVLENRAHRKGIPPGWLTCNFTY